MIAMTDAAYVFLGWGVSLAVLGAYALRVLQRGRSLSRRVPPAERRWS
jgi:hypothetical protein